MLTVREAAAVVRELRESRAWTPADLARAARVSRAVGAALEAGKSTVEASKLFDLFQAMGHEVALRSMTTDEVRW